MESTIAVVAKQNEHLRPKAVFETRPAAAAQEAAHQGFRLVCWAQDLDSVLRIPELRLQFWLGMRL